jgi:hypothetical protein
MNEKDFIIDKLKNASLIIRDAQSFLFLNFEQKNKIDEHKLGLGSFSTSISLFALINFVSKIYFILNKGNEKTVTSSELDEYERLKKVIQDNTTEWRNIKKYFKKPRIGDINETDAFVFLIEKCPIDFGIEKTNKEQICEIWQNYRNKLTHLISLKGNKINGQMLINLVVNPSEEGMYKSNLKFIKERLHIYKAFDITEEKTKKTFLAKKEEIIINFGHEFLQRILKDKCHIERLVITVEMLIEWLIEEIRSDKFSKNYNVLISWLEDELKTRENL